MTSKSVLSISLLVFALCVPPAFAKVTEEEAERLGKDLTPLGAEAAGEGDVSAWTGGISFGSRGVAFDPKTEHPPNPFLADKINYTITPENMTEHDALLTEGHKAMLKRVTGFKMNVYTSRRNCTAPRSVQQATKRNARNAEVTLDGEGVSGGWMGTPFPIPQSGREVMWNHRLRYQPRMLTRYVANAFVHSNGEFKLIGVKEQIKNNWVTRLEDNAEAASDEGKGKIPIPYLAYKREVIAPAALAGSKILTHESINTAVVPRKVWMYTPGSRRVRRAPDMAYDDPGFGTEAMATADTASGFEGALDRYDWSIRSRSVRAVPYNSNLIAASKYSVLLEAKRLNPDLTRYEPHRVWIVDAVLRVGSKHTYERRTLFVDEDTWAVVAGEIYDSRGQLWRVQEVHLMNFYNVPACLPVAEVIYELGGDGAYFVGSLVSEEQPLNLDLDDKHLQPESIWTSGGPR